MKLYKMRLEREARITDSHVYLCRTKIGEGIRTSWAGRPTSSFII